MCNNVYAEVQELLCGNFGQQSLRVTLPFVINLILQTMIGNIITNVNGHKKSRIN